MDNLLLMSGECRDILNKIDDFVGEHSKLKKIEQAMEIIKKAYKPQGMNVRICVYTGAYDNDVLVPADEIYEFLEKQKARTEHKLGELYYQGICRKAKELYENKQSENA